MKENVGTEDQIFRSVLGPSLMAIGYTRLDGREGRTAGLATMIAGALTIESAITQVCPVNALLGIDTRRRRGTLDRIRDTLGIGG